MKGAVRLRGFQGTGGGGEDGYKKGARGAVQELGRGQEVQCRSWEGGKGCTEGVGKGAIGAVQELGRGQGVKNRS